MKLFESWRVASLAQATPSRMRQLFPRSRHGMTRMPDPANPLKVSQQIGNPLPTTPRHGTKARQQQVKRRLACGQQEYTFKKKRVDRSWKTPIDNLSCKRRWNC